jgi:hypothetical protein
MEGLELLAASGLAYRLLSPTADYVGNEVKDWTERRVTNVRRIVQNAAKKVDQELLESGEGSVSPRVLRGLLDEGSFVEDQIAVEYLGGVLASSFTTEQRDDRGAAWLALIAQLSTYQLRLHYFLFVTASALLREADDIDWSSVGKTRYIRRATGIYVPDEQLEVGLDLTEREKHDWEIVYQSMRGLAHFDLVGPNWGLGPQKGLREIFGRDDIPGGPKGGLIFRPSPRGFELFAWAHGQSSLHITRWPKLDIGEPSIPAAEGAVRLKRDAE